ncbi:hypothetical protein HS041_32510 [Planomonospora sp. ID67723]|uniref:hypothetical protein n=1 Tax=Planomonospora sp. ID67723 TaxID=2738134 RepID=UPI0018C40614|nr:hypothetical protein [Planomonospora sp. ID67723]MBG0832430.1 hypothetical protein [Planomonospora sp. ID67723]
MSFFTKKVVENRLVATALGAAVAASLPLSAPSAPASATSQAPRSVCGPGFKKVEEREIKDYGRAEEVVGRVHLFYSRTADRYCAVTIKSATPGKRAKMEVGLGTRARSQINLKKMSSGKYKSYIGPITERLKTEPEMRCVHFYGMIQIPGRDPVVAEGKYIRCPGGGSPGRRIVGVKARGR